jgi:hypothetical protein
MIKLDQRVRHVVANLFVPMGDKKRSAKSVKEVFIVNTDVRNQDVNWDVVVRIFVHMGNAKSIVRKGVVVVQSVDMELINGDVERKEIANIVNTKKINYIVKKINTLFPHLIDYQYTSHFHQILFKLYCAF